MFVYGFAVPIDWETHQLYLKTETASNVQWRATPSGSFREPVDYKEQEPSNLVFSEFRRSIRAAKLFLYYNSNALQMQGVAVIICVVCFYLRGNISNGTLNETPLSISDCRLGIRRSLNDSQLRCSILLQPASAIARPRGKNI